MKQQSLARCLLYKLFIPILATLLIIGGVSYYAARQEIDEVYDSELITAAHVLWLVNRAGGDSDVDLDALDTTHSITLEGIDQRALDNYAEWRAFRLWKNGKIVIASDNARPQQVPPAPSGFTDFVQNNEHWRGFTLHIPQEGGVVEVSEKQAVRLDLIGNIAQGLLWPLLGVLPVIGVLVWRGVYSGLADLRLFAEAIKRRSPDDLAKIDAERAPQELKPLADGLNQLLCQLEASLTNERMFIDNAAHELRTPLAAIGIQADVARSATRDADRSQALNALAGGVARAAKLVDRMLLLGRLQHQTGASEPVMLYALAREAVKTHVPAALQKNIEIALQGDETLQALGRADLFTIMLGNLIENAVKYTPPAGRVTIEVLEANHRPVIRITDTGPGIALSEREKVFERFYRVAEDDHPGSGLGLAIVKHIAQGAGVGIALAAGADGTGLCVTLLF